jgi:hypothetical protein
LQAKGRNKVRGDKPLTIEEFIGEADIISIL